MENSRPLLERKAMARPQKDQALNCPRCNSINTKFCYYNNYSLSQPRYFCKTCRRYWTEGGSLRNVPVGGGSRKNSKRSTPSSSSTSSTAATPSSALPPPPPPSSSAKMNATDLTHSPSFPPQYSSSDHQNPKIHQGQDLNLAYPPSDSHDRFNNNTNSTSTTSSHHHLFASKRFSSLLSSSDQMAENTNMYGGGFPTLHEFKPTGLNFSLEGFDSGYGSVQPTTGLLFPNEDLKQHPTSSNEGIEQNRRQQPDSTGYWNGMFGGGSWLNH